MGADTLLTRQLNVVVFDTSCLLCSRFIRVLLKNDRQTLYYTGFESEFSENNLPKKLLNNPVTVVYYSNGQILLRSKAVFAILRSLRFPYPLARVFRIIPTGIADRIYDYIAAHRYGWFGKLDECFVPDANERSRFLD